MVPWYVPKRDGRIEDYLRPQIKDMQVFRLFKGYKHFKLLWDEGYLQPHQSIIRVMYNTGRGDEHYFVLDEFQLEGLEAQFHSGLPGIHDARKLLAGNAPAFEAHSLNHLPIARRKTK